MPKTCPSSHAMTQNNWTVLPSRVAPLQDRVHLS